MPRIFERYVRKARSILQENWSGSYTRPSPSLYPHQWSWDSAFIALGKASYDPASAMEEMERLFSAQWSNGMVPQIVYDRENLGRYFPEPDFWQTEGAPNAPKDRLTSGITMPPIHAVAVEKIHDRAGGRGTSRSFLRRIYPRLLDQHRFLYRERDPDGTGLVYIRHPWESGIDNSPVWDAPLRAINVDGGSLPAYQRRDLGHVTADVRPSDDDYDRYVWLVDLFRRLGHDEPAIREECPFLVWDPLFNSILCRANQSLIRLAEEAGVDASEPRDWTRRTTRAIRERLWCPDRKLFYPMDLRKGDLIREDTSTGFLPLYAGAADDDQARRLYERLDSLSFCRLHQGNCYTVPNYDTQAEDFDRSNYWRGPVWININWMLAEGLSRYGYTLKADSLRRDLLQLPIRFGFFEYYDSFSGKGYGSENFSWTASLFVDLVSDHYRREVPRRPLLTAFLSLAAPKKTLNTGSDTPLSSGDRLAAELMETIRSMRDTFYDTERGLVDYEALGRSEAFARYRVLTNGLRRFDPSTLDGSDHELSFWINLYNTIVVDGIVTLGVKKSVLEVPGFFHRVAYSIGGRKYTPDDVEHGIIRGNARPWRWPLRPFAPWDARRRLALEQPDPRAHFALVCGSRSCAPIEHYEADRIDEQLDEAARSFVNSSEVMVFPGEDRILLSEIFRWYEKDFGGRSGVLDFISDYLVDDELARVVRERGRELTFEYLFYDWNLNRWGK